MVKKSHLHQTKYPFYDYPFEAMCCGSWQALERIRIKNGTLTFHLVDDQFMVLERGPFSDVRIRSRKANLFDCTRLLRPGIDICVLTTSGSDLEDSKPVWIDAKISSIERKPHDYSCLCEFYVNFYTSEKPLGLRRGKLSKELYVVGINQISILQKFQKKYCEGQYYRWDFSENTSFLRKTKILVGQFLSDISWLIVTSAVKRISFDVRSVENKIVYEILGGHLENRSFDSNRCLNTVNFKVEDEKIVPLVIRVGSDDTVEDSSVSQTYENKLVPYFASAELRRSKRRKVQPDRYLGCDNIDKLEIDYNKLRPYRTDQCDDDDDEMTMPLSCLFGMKSSGPEDRMQQNRIKFSSSTTAASKKLIVFKKNSSAGDMKSSFSDKNKDKMELAIVPVPEHNELIAFDSYLHSDEMAHNYSGQITEMTEISPKYYYINTTRKVRRRSFIPDLEDMEFAKTWEGTSSSTKLQRTSYHNTGSKGYSNGEERVYKKRSLGAGGYKDLINSFLKMAGSSEKKEDPQIIDQWKEFKEKSRSDRRQEAEPPSNEDEQELSENEMLWREMELSLASSYLSEDYEVSNAGFSTDTEKGSSNECCHEYILNEELGILCHICGFVSTEIKNVTSPFMQYTSWNMEEKPSTENNAYREADDEKFDVSHGSDLSDSPVIEDNENVWALIPELRRKLHLHQKKAFEFLWQNIAGSIDPALMKSTSKKIGGCVVSHSPGAGKTFLIIAFLVSYLKLFPGKRPLVLAPKTTLYTWYKEFIKWEIPVPVHLIHGRRSYRVFRPKNVSFPGFGKPTDDVMHILDCLEKIQKWHAHPSVLVMGYTSFLTLMRDDSAFPHRKFMSRVLRESPGILILDEGHNPRSTKSRLRKGLMKIHTDLRILLSGTLFQNNFGEYFNTLCLARPKFVKEVLKELDPKYKRKNRSVKKAWSLQEARARKYFLDNIAKKIDSDVGEDRMKGLNMLRSLTTGFIDVYEGGNAECLPGLQIYTLLMNSTDMQKEILGKLHRAMERVVGFPLEIELLITLGSIHPSLVTSAVCSGKFFSEEELRGIGMSRFDLRKGSKVRFVLNLVHHIAKREKILVFCHNIAPVKYFVDLFESFFRWKRGREVLILTGDLELFERGKIMDTFEDPGSPSRVLLASITACAEGISLTAASRVILLDSEWNPSKTKQAIARAFRPGQQKVVYVYQLLMSGTLEEDKYRRTTWKEWVSSMIFSEAFVEDPSKWQAEKNEFEDDVLREIVEEDRSKSFHMILKNEKASTTIRGKD